MNAPICLLTGGTSGIGMATAIELAHRGMSVVLAARTQERGTRAATEIRHASGNERVVAMTCDLESQASIREFAAAYLERFETLDVLIHSGAAVMPSRELTADGVEVNFATAYLSIFLLSTLLRDILISSAPSRVIIISGELHRNVSLDFDDLMGEKRFSMIQSGSRAALAKIVFANELARRLEGTGVTVNCLHPGAVRTNLLRNLPWYLRAVAAPMQLFFASPRKGARTPVYLATSPEITKTTGKYFIDCKEVEPSATSRDPAIAEKLWTASEALIAPSFSARS